MSDNASARPPRPNISRSTRLELLSKAGGRCSFPDCSYVQVDEGLPLLELSFIVSPSRATTESQAELTSAHNLVVLCPTHNRITTLDGRYTADWLLTAKSLHERRVRESVQLAGIPAPKLVSSTVRNPLVDAIAKWSERTGEENEEHWHQLFVDTPGCFALMLQGRAYRLGGKAYVGGKRVDNRGGNELDFLAVHKTRLACIEIKKPTAALLGKPYRGNVRLPSEDLVGGCVQVLESRRSLVQSLDLLNARAEPEDRLVADSPPACFVIVGDLSREKFTIAERSSFELFRSSLRDVVVITYDELFDGIAQMLEFTQDA